MTEDGYKFTCLGYKPASNGEVYQYILAITGVDEEVETLAVTPREIASHHSMTRILLGKNVIYMPTKKEHDQMLGEIFAKPPCVIGTL
ncbi:hypothetical protein [uncultured Castellaniella sp.]|uniref:hypothetical protein n=1 Tax=uncultured Castellaniella sp. TaxID=647907 RepID=UPI002626871C|nr:hypothetical protein [uncultured Castellaniella sp.]